jgi:hypothetical protein
MDARRIRLAALLAAFGVLLGGAPLAATEEEPDPDLIAAVQAAERNDFDTAIRLLDALVRRDGFNADAYAWLAYAVRRKAELEP